jgi:hypothetical protein
MNKTNKILIALLVAQAALALITWSAGKDVPEVTKKTALFDFKSGDVTQIQVVATQGDKVQPALTFKKDGDKWVLASADDFPVNAEKITELLDMMTVIEVDTPIATTEANHAALNVGDDAFDRKITFTVGGKDVVVFVGRGSQGSAHVRLGDSKDVYAAIGLSVWSINSRASNYVDNQYVKIEPDKAKSITVTNAKGTINIVKDGDNWDIPGLVEAVNTDIEAVDKTDTDSAAVPKQVDKKGLKSFVEKFLDVKLAEPLGKKEDDSYGLKDGATVVIETEKDGKPHKVTLTIGAKDDGSQRYVKSSDSEYIVKVANYGMEPATQKVAKDFLKDAKPEGEDADEPQMPMGMQGMPPGMQGMPPGMMMPQ